MRQTDLHTGLLVDTNMIKAVYSATTSTSVTTIKGIVKAGRPRGVAYGGYSNRGNTRNI